MRVKYSPDGRARSPLLETRNREACNYGIVRHGHSKSILMLKGYDSFDKVAYSSDGRFLAAGSSDGTARLWDAVSGNHASESLQDIDHGWRALPSVLMVGYLQLVVVITPFVYGRQCSGISSQNPYRASLRRFGRLFSVPDGKMIAGGGCPNDKISLWDVATGQLRKSLTGHGALRSTEYCFQSRWQNNRWWRWVWDR